MSKYPNEQTVGAVYDDAPVGNPFLAAMPDMLPPEKCRQAGQGVVE